MAKLVVGLGNPGKKYADTRHNIGFMVVEKLAEEWGISLKEEAIFHGRYAKREFYGQAIHLLLPETYMNESGYAVQSVSAYYKLLACDIIVVADDIHLAFQELRVKQKGSPGGHNGLASIEKHLGTNYYPRLKCGIGNDREGSLADHVLERFKAEEREKLPSFIEEAVKVLKSLLHDDIHKVMNAVNRSTKNEKETKSL